VFFRDNYHVDIGMRPGVMESHDEIVPPYYFYLGLPRKNIFTIPVATCHI
jgi:hypothetical protein